MNSDVVDQKQRQKKKQRNASQDSRNFASIDTMDYNTKTGK